MIDTYIIYQIYKTEVKDDEVPYVYTSLDKALKFCADNSNERISFSTRPSYIDENTIKDDTSKVYIVVAVDQNYSQTFPIIFVNKADADKYVADNSGNRFYLVIESVLVR